MDSTSIDLEHVVRAPVQRVFDAWTRPEHVQRWWGPAHVTCPQAEIDLREGGKYRIANKLEDGSILWISGEFLTIDPPTRLIFTWQVNDQPASELVTVSFEAFGDGTRVAIRHERIVDPDVVRTHRMGWEGCLTGLEKFLSGPGYSSPTSR